eukprot:TRINITY_DN1202_c0_g1_i1.p1 TRINITY_DN1202_c0_g1~~TRINITY_DN1202_c0_g1_i1.p1  ORF type:complete len:465 (-),score=68.53 TRINITY_DN1202_c0_g1_i1:39-1391(-)
MKKFFTEDNQLDETVIQLIWNIFDEDTSGFLEQHEAERFLGALYDGLMGRPNQMDKRRIKKKMHTVALWWSVFDSNSDGLFSWDEFVRMLHEVKVSSDQNSLFDHGIGSIQVTYSPQISKNVRKIKVDNIEQKQDRVISRFKRDGYIVLKVNQDIEQLIHQCRDFTVALWTSEEKKRKSVMHNGLSYGEGKTVYILNKDNETNIPYSSKNINKLENGGSLQQLAEYLEDLSKRILSVIATDIGLDENCFTGLIESQHSNHKLEFGREKSKWIMSRDKINKKWCLCDHGLLSIYVVLQSNNGGMRTNITNEELGTKIVLDSQLEICDLLVLPGKTLNSITAGYIPEASYRHLQYSLDPRFYVKYYAEAPNNTVIDVVNLLSTTKLADQIPEQYQKVLRIDNLSLQESQYQTATRLVSKKMPLSVGAYNVAGAFATGATVIQKLNDAESESY